MREESDLMLAPMIMSTMTEGAAAYAMQHISISHSKPRRGHTVGCHVCGLSRVTLYKDGKARICGKCRAALEGGTG